MSARQPDNNKNSEEKVRYDRVHPSRSFIPTTVAKKGKVKPRDKEICDAINHYGSGQHPWADADSLSYFKQDYIEECLRAKYNAEHREPQSHGDDGEDYAPLPTTKQQTGESNAICTCEHAWTGMNPRCKACHPSKAKRSRK